MSQTDLDFSCLKDNYGGLLTPEDVHLFYYDIGIDAETGHSFIYSWDNDVESFISKQNLNISECTQNQIPLSVSANQIFFSLCDKDEGNKAVAFFRHLRNAFSHYHIGLSGDFYNIKDTLSDGKTVTMLGKIQRDAFKGLIDVFLKQKAETENEYFHFNTPDI